MQLKTEGMILRVLINNEYLNRKIVTINYYKAVLRYFIKLVRYLKISTCQHVQVVW